MSMRLAYRSFYVWIGLIPPFSGSSKPAINGNSVMSLK